MISTPIHYEAAIGFIIFHELTRANYSSKLFLN